MEKNMKKVLVSLLLLASLVLGCFGLVACDTGEKPSNQEVEVEGLTYDGSEGEITFYHTMAANLRTVLD